MSLWGNADNAANSAIFALMRVNRSVTVDERTDLFGNTTANVYFSGATYGQFGVSADEMSGRGGIASVTVTAAGDSLNAISNVAFTGTNTTPATAISRAKIVGATANQSYLGTGGWETGDIIVIDETGGANQGTPNLIVTTTEVNYIEVGTNPGWGYANGDVISVNTGIGIQATANVATSNANGSILTLDLWTRGSYTVSPTEEDSNTTTSGAGANATVNVHAVIETISIVSAGIFNDLPDEIANNEIDVSAGVGNTCTIDLNFGINDVIVTGNGAGYTSGLTGITFEYGANAAATPVIQGSVKPSHAGWNLRIVGSGGRAGRVSFETLVAGGSMTEDAEDDIFHD